MALIPGTLPPDTCYGTPQDLLELFAQYLDVPAFALNSKVVFSTSSTGLTADVIWFDTTAPTNPIMKITVSGGFTDYVNNYVKSLTPETAAAGDFVLISDVSDSGNSKKVTAQSIANLAPAFVIANGSITYPKLSNSATEADNVAKRTVKAWVNFNGSGPSIYSTQSFNISSISRSAAGTFTISYTTAMSAANYAVIGTVGTGTENYTNVAAASVRLYSATTTDCTIVTALQSSNGYDFGYTCIAVLSA